MASSMEYNPLKDPCLSCGLWKGKKNPCIRPKVYRKVDVVFIGEAPGAEEDDHGEAFVGRSGRILREILDRMGDRGEWEVLNAARCRPTNAAGSNRPPTAREVELCAPFLEEDLRRLEPRTVVALGLSAAGALGIPALPLRDLRHRSWDTPYGKAYVTWHPAAGLRPGKAFVFKEIADDLARILQVPEMRAVQQLPEVPQVRGTDQNPALTKEAKCGILALQDGERVVVDIETSGFLKDGDPFPFDGKGEILLIGAEEICQLQKKSS